MGGIPNTRGLIHTRITWASHQRRHKSQMSLHGPLCTHGVSGTPHGEVRDNDEGSAKNDSNVISATWSPNVDVGSRGSWIVHNDDLWGGRQGGVRPNFPIHSETQPNRRICKAKFSGQSSRPWEDSITVQVVRCSMKIGFETREIRKDKILRFSLIDRILCGNQRCPFGEG